jgi:hypothetical protein
MKVTFDDSVTKLLEGFAADQGVVSRVVGAIGLAFKEEARDSQRKRFEQHSGKFNRSIWYKQGRKSARATLFGGNLASIYEKNGAWIQPMEGEAMKFQIGGNTVFYKGVIRIPPRPYFYPAVNAGLAEGLDKKTGIKQIDWEIKEHNLG